MNVLMMKSTLLVIRKKEQAQEILDEVRRQGAKLSFDTSGGTASISKAVFTPVVGSSDWVVWEPKENIGIDPVFQASIQLDEADAVNRLYDLRKHYNDMWRD